MFMLLAYAATYRDAPPTDVPNFKQTDPRWADIVYSNHGDKSQTVKYGGCALCSVASVVNYLCDNSVTPADMAKLSLELGTCSDGGGTYVSFYKLISHYYPLVVTVTKSLDEATDCLDGGGLVIMSRAKHSILIYAHTGADYWMHDSGWGDDLLSQIMGHKRYDTLIKKDATYYCYKKRM